jgi:hypothetical protein
VNFQCINVIGGTAAAPTNTFTYNITNSTIDLNRNVTNLANQTFNQTALNTTGIAGIWLLGNGQAGVATNGIFSTGCIGAVIFSEQPNRLFNSLKYGDKF